METIEQNPDAPEGEEAQGSKDHGVLYLGIDLGTSRTSISGSNGVRGTTGSLVGYPKDHVARKLLKKDVLFGDEALEKRLSLRMFRPRSRAPRRPPDRNRPHSLRRFICSFRRSAGRSVPADQEYRRTARQTL